MNDFETKGAAIDAAAEVIDPVSSKSLLDAHILDEVDAKDGVVTVRLSFPESYPRAQRWEVEDAVADRVGKLGAKDVRVSSFVKGAASPPASAAAGSAPAAEPRGHAHDHAHDHGHAHGHDHAHAHAPAPARPKTSPVALQGVGRVIAVASGKGGVGKSTVAVNLALALQHLGFRVGLLDIDVYGPSLPVLLGVNERPNVQDKRIIPVEARGLKLMSLGFLMDDDTPVIWRGPIVTGIIRQFLQDVDWGGTDYLIVDMPPGTGDAQLSLAQTVPVDGAIVVTTPSDLALADAARGLKMFQTLNVEVLGMVENMAWYAWPGASAVESALTGLAGVPAAAPAVAAIRQALATHGKLHIFGEGGGRREAQRLETPFLGEIPLDGEVRAGGDSGSPIVAANPTSDVGKAFIALAQRVTELKPLETSEGPKKKGLFSFFRS